ncbi:MAG: hypothetical protein HZB39_12125 [Planctomycetes bacterium]|nr:hypothetical protein [Planctomycetota bacterium]
MLIPWIEEAKQRPLIVDPTWIGEVGEAFAFAQILVDRVRRYILGSGIQIPSRRYLTDPVLKRHEHSSQERSNQLRYYLHELITALRAAKNEHRVTPRPGERTRRRWWTDAAKPRPPQSEAEPSIEDALPKPPTSKTPPKRRRRRKLYRSSRVRKLLTSRTLHSGNP